MIRGRYAGAAVLDVEMASLEADVLLTRGDYDGASWWGGSVMPRSEEGRLLVTETGSGYIRLPNGERRGAFLFVDDRRGVLRVEGLGGPPF